LVVQGDDFGMCHALNEGVATAFTDGILTQTSTMVPCPWFDEAAALARALAIPAGVHLTLTCEWDHLRWRPLTAAASLRDGDGTFHRTVAAAQASLDDADAQAELVAQVARFQGAGLEPRYFDCHMGLVAPHAYAEVCTRFGRPFLYRDVEPHVAFTSVANLSHRDAETKEGWLLGHIAGLGPGLHLLVCHPGVPGPELAAITRPDSSLFPWAEEYRRSHLPALTSARVRSAAAARPVEPTRPCRRAR